LFDEEIVRTDNQKIEDRILLKAACEGCRDSLTVIYGRYGPAVHDYLMRAGADGMAEDVCQAVFIRIGEGKCNYNPQTDVDKYLCKVAKNILRDHRRIKTEATYSPEVLEMIIAEQGGYRETDSLEIAEEHQILKEMVSKLPLKARKAIRSAFFEGNIIRRGTVQKSASGTSDAFRMRLSYAIKLLREKYIRS
jgi:RNA polymerase sigma factor (sigma-70 family)